MHFGEEVNAFLRAANDHGVRMLLIGGGAVNFHGYQRQSPDLDFWMEPIGTNFQQLAAALRSIGYEVDAFPESVLKADRNITLKMSPGLEVEIITFLRPGYSFDEAWSRAELVQLAGESVNSFRVLNFPDLIESKLRSGRPKDLLDVQELKRRRGLS
jgi:hypothetical protein